MQGPPLQAEMERRRWEAEKLGEAGRSPGSSPMQQLAHMMMEAGPSGASGIEPAGHLRPRVGGKAPWKKFLKTGHVKKPKRYQLGMVMFHKICHYQMSTELLIHKHPFVRLVHEIAQDCGHYDLHFQVCMVMALHEAAE